MEVWKKIWGYLTFQKQNPDEETSFNLKFMHGINRISILMFLVCVVIIIVKLAT